MAVSPLDGSSQNMSFGRRTHVPRQQLCCARQPEVKPRPGLMSRSCHYPHFIARPWRPNLPALRQGIARSHVCMLLELAYRKLPNPKAGQPRSPIGSAFVSVTNLNVTRYFCFFFIFHFFLFPDQERQHAIHTLRQKRLHVSYHRI